MGPRIGFYYGVIGNSYMGGGAVCRCENPVLFVTFKSYTYNIQHATHRPSMGPDIWKTAYFLRRAKRYVESTRYAPYSNFLLLWVQKLARWVRVSDVIWVEAYGIPIGRPVWYSKNPLLFVTLKSYTYNIQRTAHRPSMGPNI